MSAPEMAGYQPWSLCLELVTVLRAIKIQTSEFLVPEPSISVAISQSTFFHVC